MRFYEIMAERGQRERKAAAGVQHDQFFTRPEVAEEFSKWVMSWVKQQPFYSHKKRIRKIEPAAGNQDIARWFRGIEVYDLDPQHPNIKKQDFLKSNHQPSRGLEKTIVIMNPPFGKRNSLAIQFFNKAATFANVIAQIVPIGFMRDTLHSQLDANWHLDREVVLPKNSFYLKHEGPDRGYNVPAVAQIWVKRSEPRPPLAQLPTPNGLEFVSPAQANLAIRRVGTVGKITKDLNDIQSKQSFIYLKVSPEMEKRLLSVDWSSYGKTNVGPPNLTRRDVIKAVSN